MTVWLLLFALGPADGQADWQWPVNAEFGATSSFGEYRGGRFHMGLDFSTGGVEGEPVRPARNGTVEKVRAQAHGYGRVVYLRHGDGYQSVYAHLAAFGPKIQAAIRAKGHDPDSYFGTLMLSAPVTTADLLAHSGESGAGLPHLHFEIRDPQNRPRDPLALNFPPLPVNTGKPHLEGLFLQPLQQDSLVNGSVLPQFVPAGVTRIQARGPVGIQVIAHQRGPRGSRLGLRGLRIHLNGKKLGEWLPRTLDYVGYHQAGLIYDQARSGFSPTRFTYCFDGRAAYLPAVSGYRQADGATISETTKLSVDLLDMKGEWHSYAFQLSPDLPARIDPHLPPLPILQAAFRMDALGNRLLVQAGQVAGTLETPDRIIGLRERETTALEITPGREAFLLNWRTKNSRIQRWVGCLPPGARFDYAVAGWRLRVDGLPKLPAQTVFVEPPDPKIMAGVLEYAGDVLRFGREGLPSQGLTATYVLPPGNSAAHIGLYAWSYNSQKWRFWGAAGSDGKLVVDLDYFTPLVAARDTSPPAILKPKFHRYFAGRRVVIPLRDQGSGIDPESVKVENPQGRVQVEYDRDRRWIILPASEKGGPWTVTVRDRTGLESRSKRLKL